MSIDDELRWKMEVVERMTRMEGKLDAIVEKVSSSDSRLDDLETRVGNLERARLYSRGWMAGALAIAGSIGAACVKIVERMMGV